jgi:hypothetical protein
MNGGAAYRVYSESVRSLALAAATRSALCEQLIDGLVENLLYRQKSLAGHFHSSSGSNIRIDYAALSGVAPVARRRKARLAGFQYR